MRIVTYTCLEGGAPKGAEAIARIAVIERDLKGRPVEVWHPVVVHHSTAELAREKAQVWWDGELAKAEQKRANADAARERMASARKAKVPAEVKP